VNKHLILIPKFYTKDELVADLKLT